VHLARFAQGAKIAKIFHLKTDNFLSLCAVAALRRCGVAENSCWFNYQKVKSAKLLLIA
jgi:hypothetical protein